MAYVLNLSSVQCSNSQPGAAKPKAFPKWITYKKEL